MSCLICQHPQLEDLFRGIRSCPACRFAQADLSLTPAQWQNLYTTKYFFGEEYADYLSEEAPLRRNFRRNLAFMSRFCPSGKLLEIGCAYGFFLDEAQRNYTVTGVDIHAEGCAYAREHFNVNALTGDLLTMPLELASYDAIVMWDVLEHLPNPREFVARAQSLLKPGGTLFFATLDITSWLATFQGAHWRQIHPPTHVSYFSRKALNILLDTSGFDVLTTRYFGEYRSWDNTFYTLLVLHWHKSKLYEALKQRSWIKGEYFLNTFDHIYVAARKR
ncbi:MAG: class I SAM-dependent methyltransferase [Candidatus Omnitrophota bacterium]